MRTDTRLSRIDQHDHGFLDLEGKAGGRSKTCGPSKLRRGKMELHCGISHQNTGEKYTIQYFRILSTAYLPRPPPCVHERYRGGSGSLIFRKGTQSFPFRKRAFGSEGGNKMCLVLIVEDNATFRHSLKDVLQTQFPSMGIEEAADSEEALIKLRGLEPDLIFMDIKLPAETVWNLPGLSRAPIPKYR